MKSVEAQELYHKYEVEFQKIQDMKKVYEEQKSAIKSNLAGDNKYIKLLQDSIEKTVTESVDQLVEECQKVIYEALDNLSPETDTQTMQSLVDLEDMLLKIKSDSSIHEKATLENPVIIVRDRTIENIPENQPDKEIVIKRKNETDTNADADADSLHHIDSLIEEESKLEEKKQQNAKAAVYVLTNIIKDKNIQFRKIGVRAYLGISDIKENIYRALQEQTLIDEMEFQQRIKEIARSEQTKQENNEHVKKSKKLGILRFFKGTSQQNQMLGKPTEEFIYKKLLASNKRILNVLQSEIKSMTRTIDINEKMIRSSKTRGFEDEVKEAETRKVVDHAIKIINSMQGDQAFVVGYGDLAITKTNGEITFLKNEQIVSRKDFITSIKGHSRMFSSSFNKFLKAEIIHNEPNRENKSINQIR